jgi:hypothetical protein
MDTSNYFIDESYKSRSIEFEVKIIGIEDLSLKSAVDKGAELLSVM